MFGGLFGNQTLQNNRTELVLFVTPRLVENEIDMRDVMNDLRRRMERLDNVFPVPSAPLCWPGSLAGTTVLIQKQQGAAWPTVAQTIVAADGNFVAALQLTTGIYRARVNSGHGFVVGFSPVVQVTTP